MFCGCLMFKTWLVDTSSFKTQDRNLSRCQFLTFCNYNQEYFWQYLHLFWIFQVIELPLINPELFQRVGIAPPKGCLLYGPPGKIVFTFWTPLSVLYKVEYSLYMGNLILCDKNISKFVWKKRFFLILCKLRIMLG